MHTFQMDESQTGKFIMEVTVIFVGCILLRYLHILYKPTTQNYTCNPQTQLTTSLLFQNLTTCLCVF
jgi:hypothetical protein